VTQSTSEFEERPTDVTAESAHIGSGGDFVDGSVDGSGGGSVGGPVGRRPNPLVEEVSLLLLAVMFYTRIRTPKWVGYSDDRMNRATRHFPVIGWLTGVVVAGVLWVTQLILPLPVAVVLGLAVGVLVTGGFHEDGFADVCDGFGGGATTQRTLDIMKDSRLGVFAVLGLVLLFALKITALSALLADGLWAGLVAIVFAHVLSRWCVVTIIFRGTYARPLGPSKARAVAHALPVSAVVVATCWLIPFAGLAWWHPWWLLAIPAGFLVRLLLGHWFTRRLGGYTGDCLGATQQIIEIVTIVVCLGLAGVGL
jgi:adenosylcobinamide-GDP ribazoletransferase